MKNDSKVTWFYYKEPIGGQNTSFVIRDLSPNTAYKIRLTGNNKYKGSPVEYKEWVQTLAHGKLIGSLIVLYLYQHPLYFTYRS
jgi:hypothetical protein